ncbi:alpha/beta hydrolase, partial [Hyella patelloides]|uniref:alpha/beta hydrolase n=1 Tax=Hyella patelloides TaxID=1982969 RepID=UPI0011A9CB79
MWGLRFKQYLLGVSSFAIAMTIAIAPIESVNAAEKIKFNHGIVGQSISLEELEVFAQTGEISPSLDFLFKFTGHKPEVIRLLLIQEIPMDAVTASSLLNSSIGGYILDRASNIVNSGASQGNREALRGALIGSASGDNKISLLEVWRNYPTKEVVVDGQSWRAMNQGFSSTLQQVGKTAGLSVALLRNFLSR